MSESNRIDLESPTANMFGVEPCPKCGSIFRHITKDLLIVCYDCGLNEKVANPEVFGANV